MVNRRFGAVIFDMDGVLVDSEPMHAETARELLAGFGVEFRDEDNRRYSGVTDAELFRDLLRRHGLTASVDELVRRRAELVVKRTWANPNAMAGVPDVLRALHDARYRLALASSFAIPSIDTVWAASESSGFSTRVPTMPVVRPRNTRRSRLAVANVASPTTISSASSDRPMKSCASTIASAMATTAAINGARTR